MIYILDGDELFVSAAEAMRRLSRFPDRTGVKPAVVVGVTPRGQAGKANRYRDYTFGPPADPSSMPREVECGMGNALLAFLRDGLPHLVGRRISIDPADVSIYGHSLSGYFALSAACARPDSFRVCAAVSPSLWWHEDGILGQAANLQRTRVFLACGEKEIGANEERHIHRAMAPRLKTLEGVLNLTHSQDDFASRVFAGEDHGSVATIAIPSFLRFRSAAVRPSASW